MYLSRNRGLKGKALNSLYNLSLDLILDLSFLVNQGHDCLFLIHHYFFRRCQYTKSFNNFMNVFTCTMYIIVQIIDSVPTYNRSTYNK